MLHIDYWWNLFASTLIDSFGVGGGDIEETRVSREENMRLHFWGENHQLVFCIYTDSIFVNNDERTATKYCFDDWVEYLLRW